MEVATTKELEFKGTEYWKQVLVPVFKDKKIIVTGEVLAGILPRARMLQELGAASTLMLATKGLGTGEAPEEKDGPWITLNLPAAEDLTRSIEQGNRALENLPEDATIAISNFDPNKEALVVGDFLHEPPAVAGRPSFAYRRPEWLALDDKTAIDALWSEADIDHEPHKVLNTDTGGISQAMQELDEGHGVVLSGDSRDGAGGGAEGVKWVKSLSELDASLEYYREHCNRVRVMPFIEGIPCSIHGMVFDDYVASFRPVEMMVLRNNETEFIYTGTATFWDPQPADREEMRNIAKSIGEVLRRKVDYRGIFTIDGVMSVKGFRPTELNPRSGAGIKPLISSISDLPLELLAQAAATGVEIDYKPKQLEQLILENSDVYRGGSTSKAFKKDFPPLQDKPVQLNGGTWEWSEDEDNSDGVVNIGPGPLGGSFVRLSPKSSSIPVGSSFAPLAKDFWRLIDEYYDSDIGSLDIAKELR